MGLLVLSPALSPLSSLKVLTLNSVRNSMKSVKCIFIIFQVITDFVKKYTGQLRGAGS